MLLRYYGAALISLSSLLEPVFASILAVIILAEFPPMATVLGGIPVIAGVAVYIFMGKGKA
jgi:drug/metabolite transporter (DMT)-like permease